MTLKEVVCVSNHLKILKFKKFETILFKMTISIFALSTMLFGVGYMLVKAVTPAPEVVIYLATVVLYYHFAHFLISLSTIFYYLTKIRNKLGQFKIIKSILSFLFTPISFFIAYGAVFLLAISSCAS